MNKKHSVQNLQKAEFAYLFEQLAAVASPQIKFHLQVAKLPLQQKNSTASINCGKRIFKMQFQMLSVVKQT